MDSIDLNGTKYISSKEAAKRTGYAQDYVGQLARGEKIPATRVGRSWYVDEKAILVHAGITPDEEESSDTTENSSSTPTKGATLVDSTPPVRKPLHSLYTSRAGSTSSFKTWGDVRYLEDTGDLTPQVKKPLSEKTEGGENPVQINRVTTPRQEAVPAHKTSTKTQPQTQAVKPAAQLISYKSSFAVPFITVSAVLLIAVLIAGAVSGVYVPNDWTFGETQTASAGSSGEIYGNLVQILIMFFNQGVALIANFVVYLLNSLATLFEIGLNFIVNLFNLG